MDTNKVNKFLLITTILSTMILTLGATFSFFTISNRSRVNAVTVEAGKISLGLGVSDLTSGIKLVPTYDEDIMTAYEHNCVDDRGYGACNIFNFELSNFDSVQDIIGVINFNVENINNLMYMILDENDEVYLDKTSVPIGVSNGLPLGEHFVLDTGSAAVPTTRNFKLVIWLHETGGIQDDIDAGGTYTATVNYESVTGGMLTGTIHGIK